MEEQARSLPARTLGDLLNETFAIYGKHFRHLLGLMAVVQAPVALLTLIPRADIATYAVVGILSLFASMCVYGATVYAVGQHYVTGEFRVVSCYLRVWWRMMSILTLTLLLALAVVLAAPLLILVVPFVILFVFFLVAVPVVIVEGYKPLPALRRSVNLIQGSWLRVAGVALVLLLVLIGLGLVLQAPVALASWLAARGEPTALSSSFEFLGSVAVLIAVPPVVFIAGTLLYYDLRVRKEDYDYATLSREMGLAKA